MPGISVGVGSGSFKAEKHTETTEAVGSNLLANNDIQIIGKKDIAMKGSQAVGNTISMKAGGNIALEAAENRSISDTDESGRGSQAGMNFAPTGNSFYANASKGQGNEREETLIHTASQVTARENLAVESGKDTILRGSNVYGDKVAMRAGANLIIESVQDKEKYTSHVENKGMEMTTGIGKGGAGYGGISIGTSTGHTNSTYTSVTKQAGIAAGQKGYDIAVQGNTHLKGGIIDISATKGKNTLTTGTLTWEDIDFENKTLRVDRNIIKKNQSGGTKRRLIEGNSTTVWYFGNCKTPSSHRVIEIGDTLLNALKEFKYEQEIFIEFYICYHNNNAYLRSVVRYRWSVTIKSTFDLYCGIYSICIASGLYFKQTGRINWYDF